MKLAVKLGCLIVACLAPAGWADLNGDIDAALHDRLLQRASVGIEMVRLGDADARGRVVFEREAKTPLTPASNLKLATTSAALDRFGANFKFRTSLWRNNGDVVLVGDGDPSFGDGEYLRRVGWTCTTVYENWAARLRKLGITSVRDVIVDDSVFDEDFLQPHWPINQIDHWYVAEVGGVNFNMNCVDLTVDGSEPGGRIRLSCIPRTDYLHIENTAVFGANELQIGRKPGTNDVIVRGQASRGVPGPFQETVHDPPMYAATVLADTLESAGIHVTGKVRRDRTAMHRRETGSAADWKIIGINETPLLVVLSRANKDSINLYAEALCKRLGYDEAKQPGSWENGTAAVGAFLRKTGAAADEFHLDDGSGLSKRNTISPHALARVVEYDFFSPNRQTFLDSLSIAGVDGTLQERFRGTDLRRRVIGKSGFVEGVSTLTGLLRARDSRWYVFSIMMNGLPSKSNSLAKAIQEKIVRALDAHAGSVAAAE